MTITRRFAAMTTTAVVALGISACGNSAVSGESGGGDDGAVTVGFMTPKSGPYAQLGTYLDQGVQLYLDEHGGELGGREVDLVSVDEGSGPDTALPEIRKLVQKEKVVAVTGVLNSGVAAAAIPTLTNTDTPLLTTANDYASEYDHWWNVGWGNFGTTVAIADYIAKQAKGESVYLLASDYTGGHGVNGQIRDALKERGIKIAGETYTPYGSTKDYQPYLSDVKASGAKHVFAFYAGAEAIQFVKQWDTFGMDDQAQLYSNFALTEGVLPAQGKSAKGIITVSNYSPTLENPVNKKFVKAFTEAHDSKPTVYSEAMYAAMQVLDKAIGQIDGEVTGKQIQQILASGDLGKIDSPRGTWTFDKANGPEESFYILQIKDTGDGLSPVVIEEAGTYGTKGNLIK